MINGNSNEDDKVEKSKKTEKRASDAPSDLLRDLEARSNQLNSAD
jgi:hypothetical protein